MGKKINELDPATDAEAIDPSKLFALADPSTGIAKRLTVSQAKLAFITTRFKYTATGTEGSTLMISAIAGKNILLISRESAMLYLVASSPDPAEYAWNGSVITLGIGTNGGERFNIIYNNG